MTRRRIRFHPVSSFSYRLPLAVALITFLMPAGAQAERSGCVTMERAAQQGDPAREYLYAKALDDGGCGFAVDKKKAVEWYARAAAQGDMLAAYELGETYFTGDGVRPDYNEAKKWYLKAAAKGHGPSELRLGFLFAEKHFTGRTDYAEAEKWFRKAAAQDAGDARFRLGNFYVNYRHPPDMKQGLYWLRKAAEGGHRVAMFDLGRLLLKDPSAAVQKEGIGWVQKAGDADVMPAQLFLVDAYTKGKGVTADPAEALKWVLKVIATDAEPAPYFLDRAGDAYFDGAGTDRDYAAARGYYERAAAQDNVHALERLGLIYKEGLGVAKDPVKAQSYLDRAHPHP